MFNNKQLNEHLSNLLQQLIKTKYCHATLKEQIDKLRVEDRRLLLNKTSEEVRRIMHHSDFNKIQLKLT